MNIDEINPIELFQQMERKSLGKQFLETKENSGAIWRGFVFELDNLTLVVPLAGVFEVIPCNEIFPLPMAKNWVKGITNIWGEIYSVVDFSDFIGRKPIRTTKGCNLLLLPERRLKSALLIGGKATLRSFSANLSTTDVASLGPELVPYLRSVLIDDDQRWGVLNIPALMESYEFINIGR